ncbi:MAG: 16S rRNA (adenine(1518)-N(6)/adenine(1519)-N(6))-dimethyltransferase RsmA [Chlamydiales bacterium]
MKLSDLLNFLESTGAKPQKRLSQNFLIDANITRKILRMSELKEGDLVVEIGPGPGALTQELILQGHSVIAVEKDKIFAENLRKLKNASVFEADILEFNLQEKLEAALPPGKKAKVISNLPYHITSPILEKLLPMGNLLSSLTLMVQKEVAERLTAEPGSSDYSHLTLFARFFSDASYCFTVPPTCFYPRPKVDSAIVRMSLKNAPLPQEKMKQFFSMTRMAFEQRRKMLRSSLKRYAPTSILMESLEESGIRGQARPEELSLEQFLLLFHRISIKEKDQTGTKG